MSSNYDLAIITGASGDIGSAIAKRFAKEGYNLLLLGNKQKESLEKTKVECESYKVHVDSFCIDLKNSNEIESKIKPLLEGKFKAKYLVNCAGISHIGLLQDMSDSQWQNVLDTNISSVFYISRLLVPYFLKSKNAYILNISSIWGGIGASCEVAYSASKGALNSFTKALAKELAPSNIAVNALSCGMIDTKMNSCFNKEEISDICNEIPAGRMASCDEVAEAALLLTKMPTYLTGQIIGIDGGWA